MYLFARTDLAHTAGHQGIPSGCSSREQDRTALDALFRRMRAKHRVVKAINWSANWQLPT
jgi:chitinase